MKIFIFTSDKYVDIVADHAKLFNKFCNPLKEVTVLGFDPPTAEYPDNYKFVSMGKQTDFPGKNWSEPIRPFIEGLEKNHFSFFWDDMFPTFDVNEELFDEAIELVESGSAQKVHFLFGTREQYMSSRPYNDNFNQLSQTTEYRSGLAPGIWSKEYFLKYLGKDMTPWDYEIKNMPATINDGATILVPKHTPVLGWVNMFRQGKFNDWMWNNYQNSPTGHYAWNKFQKLTPDVAEIVGSYAGKEL